MVFLSLFLGRSDILIFLVQKFSEESSWCHLGGSFAQLIPIGSQGAGMIEAIHSPPRKRFMDKLLKFTHHELSAIPSTNPNWRAYSVKSRRGLNQIPDPHKFWDELDSKLADMAIDGKWFGKTLFDKNSWNKYDVQKLTNNEICLISNFETLSQV